MVYFSVFVFLLMVVNVFAFWKPKCATKSLDFDQMVGKWKYATGQNEAPSELKNSDNEIMLNVEKDGSNGIKFAPIKMGGFDDRFDDDVVDEITYTQQDPKQPAKLSAVLKLGNGEKIIEKLIIVELNPLKYLLTYSPLMKSWGLFVRPNARKLISRELKKLAGKIKCFGGKIGNFFKKIKKSSSQHRRKYEQYYF